MADDSMGKKRDRGNLVNLPHRQTEASGASGGDRGDRKLSEILKEMAQRLLQQPDAIPSSAAVEIGLLLSVAAWNDASGDPGVRNRHREMLAECDWSDGTPWSELLSADTEQLIAGLIAYKRAHYPHDHRRIVAFGMTPESRIQVQWIDPARTDTAGGPPPPPFLASNGATHGHPIADKVLAALQRARSSKVIDLSSVIAGRAAATEMLRSVASDKTLAGLHPVHAIWALVQNQVSLISEQLTSLDELKPLRDIIAKVEDEFGTGGRR